MFRFGGGLILLILFLLPWNSLQAQTSDEESREVEAVIISIERDQILDGERQVEFEARTEEGKRVHVDTSEGYIQGVHYRLKPGTRVILQLVPSSTGETTAFLVDVVRRPAMIWIVIMFALCTVLIGWVRGGLSLIGLGITLAALFGGIFPAILAGAPAVPVTILGSIFILAINMHLSHGFNHRTLVAFASTVAGLFLAFVTAEGFTWLSNLSGLASEESTLLYWLTDGPRDPVGILLAAMILGAVGVLDDIAITQSETVAELHDVNPRLSTRELFTRAMRVGRHHIASTVNTLVLAYVGVSMPLFLLFLGTPGVSTGHFLNTEGIAEEIVRTLSGTTALILTVPIATWFAALAIHRKPKKRLDSDLSVR